MGETQTLEVPFCKSCGSDQILIDAFGQWDAESQQWELHSTYDNVVCNGDCDGGETTIEWREIEVPLFEVVGP